jgi:hypothetical protein
VGADDWDVQSTDTLPLLNGEASFVNGFAGDAVVPNSCARGWLINVGVRWVMARGFARLEGIYLDTRSMRGGNQQVAV